MFCVYMYICTLLSRHDTRRASTTYNLCYTPPPPPRRYPAADLTADPAIHVQFRALARRI
jgi:hypothetical protein